ncbi:MAG: head GIN domain-containing protein [Flavobacteriales bacterium]
MKQAIALLGLFLLVSCADDQWDDCVTSTGPTRTEVRDATPFHTLELASKIDVVLTQDTVDAITVEGGRNLLGQVETSITDGVLHIGSDLTCNWVRNLHDRIKVYLHCTSLRTIVYSGSGDITCSNTIVQPTFRVDQRQGSGTLWLNVVADTCWYGMHTGPGNVIATGAADVLYLYSSGYAHIDTRDQPSRESNCNNSGSGDFRTAPSDFFYGAVNDAGNIHYYGDPGAVIIFDEGSGSVIHGD